MKSTRVLSFYVGSKQSEETYGLAADILLTEGYKIVTRDYQGAGGDYPSLICIVHFERKK